MKCKKERAIETTVLSFCFYRIYLVFAKDDYTFASLSSRVRCSYCTPSEKDLPSSWMMKDLLLFLFRNATIFDQKSTSV